MSTKNYIFTLSELAIWDDTVKNVQKLEESQAIISNTSLRDRINGNVNKRSTQHIDHTIQHDNDVQAKVLEFGDNSKINSRMLKSIKKGNYKIDKTLDLHGYSREQAYNELINFLNNACKQKYRMVLIITGKGSHSPGKQAILKNSIMDWLKIYSLNGKFLYINYAHPKHGGDGAVYVILKKLSTKQNDFIQPINNE